MKRSIYAVGIAAALVLAATPAMAQTAAPAQAQTANAPAVNLVYMGGFIGAGAVQNVTALGGGELGVHVYRGLDIIAEGGWSKDVVTRRRTDATAAVTTLLQKATGKDAGSSVKAPMNYGMAGLRYVFSVNNSIHPYVLATVGRAAVEYKPTFTLAGQDVTGSLSTYGITIGSDLVNKEVQTAYGGGFGLWYTRNMIYVDAGVRLLSIQTASQSTNVTRAHIGLGVRF